MLGDASCKFGLQIFGYAYPGYMCYKDVKQKNSDRLHLWCLYWVLMAAFSAVSPIADTFLFFIPLYYEAKLAFAIYLWANNLAGATLVYHKYAEPYIVTYEPLMDRKIEDLKLMTRKLVSTNFAKAVQWLQAKALSVLATGMQQDGSHQNGSGLRAEPAGYAAPAAGALRSFSLKGE